MTDDLIERLRDVLSIMGSVKDAELDHETKAKIQVICEEYLKAMLPK